MNEEDISIGSDVPEVLYCPHKVQENNKLICSMAAKIAIVSSYM